MAVDVVAPEELTEAVPEESGTDTDIGGTVAAPDAVDAADVGDGDPQAEVIDGGGPTRSGVRLALLVGAAAAVVLAGLVGWLQFRANESHQAQEQRHLFVQVARQGALNLTTIDYTAADADVRRILDGSIGTFHDDFEKRSKPFVDVVKQAQSKSEGSIIESGVESADGSQAQVLIAVNVKTTIAGVAEREPRAWRMRITVQKVGDGAKVSNVEFVP